MSVIKWIRYYSLELQALHRSSHTVRTYGYDLQQFVLYIRDQGLPSQMDTLQFKQACQSYLLSLQTYHDEDRDEELPYDEATINRKRSSLRSFIRFLYRLNYISEDFSSEIELSNSLAQPPQVLLTYEEINEMTKILDQRIFYGKTEELRLMHRRNKVAFLTLLETGIKVWELLILKWGNILLDQNTIVIPKRTSIETRDVPCSTFLVQEFRLYLEHMRKLKSFDPSFLDGFLFFGAGKSPMIAINPKTIERMFDSLAKEAGIETKNVTSQSLRHTMVHYQIGHQKSIDELTRLLGYSRKSVAKHMYNPNEFINIISK
ncbi:integrase/recombinase XerC [Paenibacillus sp. 1182]|uniref:tyrosine-type recombinase/integrase n=1 Tax=Paenibacillus sp. 1182 TaxID=2806565 RepID=UPI001AEA2B37|nr:tyrosine-type recombinase/integrase [Paenibacillus sp. 1182]MBP1308960.1 integrase/recombinase XerC [Paenibacillus sp. 1182]